jgi:serine/threonine-protein kinase
LAPSVIESSPCPLPAAIRQRYLPLQLIGEGAGTRVYRSYDTRTGRDVAVQLLKDGAELAPLQRRFVKAARAAMQVCHPAVVSHFEVGETDAGQPYVVMELLRGETLAEYLAREERLDPVLALRLFLDAAAGLREIHRAGLVHRDIKPGNLFLVGPRGAPQRLKVLDFGLAKLVRSNQRPPRPLIVGTTEYMPPEQILCDPVDARSDVYSLGAVMFRALTGELPFAEQPHISIMAHHLVTPIPPPSWLVDELPPGLQTVVLRAMRKHPDNRFPTMHVLEAALERIADGDGNYILEPPLTRDPDSYVPQCEHATEALRAFEGLAA